MRKNPFLELSSHLKIKPFSTQELVLENTNMTTIEPGDLKPYPNLQCLYIPNNKLKALSNLEYNIRLTYIDARNNQITDIDLKEQTFLEDLYLSGNNLHDLDSTLEKICHLRNLVNLDLRGNPLTLEKGYRNTIINAFPGLKILDGLAVTRQTAVRAGSHLRTGTRTKRPSSILQCLRERPMSSADTIVKRNANRIRTASEMKRKRALEEREADERRLKEEFEAKAATRMAPVPEAFDPLGLYKQKVETEVVEKKVSGRPTSRMYIKRPVFQNVTSYDEGEEKLTKLNPNLPPIFRHMTTEITYPK